MIFTRENFYKSKKWEKLREIIIDDRTNADGFVICAHCGKPIVKRYDCIAHHKIELTDENVNDYNISLNPDNIELIHFKCHNIQHKRFEGFKQRVYLVYGSPCSGKTTWVNSIADNGDLIVDIDAIWECLTISDRLNKSPRLKSNVFGVRDCLYEQIKMRIGNWNNAYVIGGYPLLTDRERVCRLLRATPIYIEEQKEICLSRAPNPMWRDFVEDWWADYVPDTPPL